MRSFRCRADAAIVAAAARAAQEAKRQVDLRVDCEPGEVALQELYLMGAVAELFENALRFSGHGQPVVVTVRRMAREYRIEVLDLGAVMTATERGGVAAFAWFLRSRQVPQGLGLGLAIAKLVAAIAGEKVTLVEGNADQGLQAVVESPLVGAS